MRFREDSCLSPNCDSRSVHECLGVLFHHSVMGFEETVAWMLREDYERVGFKLIPQGGARQIAGHMVTATLALVPVSLTPTLLGLTGRWYFGGALVASLAFVAVALGTARDMSEAGARKLFLASLLYHPVLLALMALDTVR